MVSFPLTKSLTFCILFSGIEAPRSKESPKWSLIGAGGFPVGSQEETGLEDNTGSEEHPPFL